MWSGGVKKCGHILQRKDPVKSKKFVKVLGRENDLCKRYGKGEDLHKDLGVGGEPLQRSCEGPCSSPDLPERQIPSLSYNPKKDPVHCADPHEDPRNVQEASQRLLKVSYPSLNLPEGLGPSPSYIKKGRIQCRVQTLLKVLGEQETSPKVLRRLLPFPRHF